MNEQNIFKKSKEINKWIIVGLWALMIVSMILLNLFLRTLADLLGLGQTGLRFLLNFFVLVFLGIATVYYLYSSDRSWVQIDDDTLTLHKWTSTKLIDFSELSSVSIHQTPLARKYGFGNLKLVFTNGEPPIVMGNIENPDMLAKMIKARLVASKQSIKIIN